MVKSAFLKLFLEAKKKMFNPIRGYRFLRKRVYQSFLAWGRFFHRSSHLTSFGLAVTVNDGIFPVTVTG